MKNNDNSLNRQAKIRNNLAQFIGTMLTNKDMDIEENKQLAVAALAENAIRITRQENGSVDIYTAKPILRAAVYILMMHVSELKKTIEDLSFEDKSVYEDTIAKYENAIKQINILVDAFKTPKSKKGEK